MPRDYERTVALALRSLLLPEWVRWREDERCCAAPRGHRHRQVHENQLARPICPLRKRRHRRLIFLVARGVAISTGAKEFLGNSRRGTLWGSHITVRQSFSRLGELSTGTLGECLTRTHVGNRPYRCASSRPCLRAICSKIRRLLVLEIVSQLQRRSFVQLDRIEHP